MYNLLVVHVSDIISSSCKWREPSEFHPYGDQDGDATWNWKLNLRKCKGKKSFQLWFAETYAHLVNTFCKWSSVFRHYLAFFLILNKSDIFLWLFCKINMLSGCRCEGHKESTARQMFFFSIILLFCDTIWIVVPSVVWNRQRSDPHAGSAVWTSWQRDLQWGQTGTAAEQHTVLSEGRPGSLQENVQ